MVYRLLLSSLPADLQARYWGNNPQLPVADPAPTLPARPVPLALASQKDWDWRFELIKPALAHPAKSRARGAAIRSLAHQFNVSERSVSRFIRSYEERGIAGLQRSVRADKGRRRVLIGNTWDRAVPFDETIKQEIAAKLRRKVRSYWADNFVRGWRHIQRDAMRHLVALTRAAGPNLTEQQLSDHCTVPRAFISRERKYRVLALKDKDAKAFSDKLPGVRRDYSYLEPLDLIIADVHPVDIYFLRPDGTVQGVRLIAWLDGKTNRLFGHILFPEKGTGPRMEHVAASFAHMVLAWGMPKALLLDNGGEYNWSEFAADAMKLVKVYGDDGRTVINALPYNARAKKIEAIFRVLERFLSTIPGWIGGNRMAAKTHNVGKAPKPFPGTQRELWDAIQQQIAAYNATPQDGLKSLSPDQAWGKKVRHVAADMATLQAAFAREEIRSVRQGEIRIGNRFYTHDALCARPYLEKVTVRIPIFGDARPAVYDPDGDFICHAEEHRAYRALDVAGARESARRKREARKGAETLRADVDAVDNRVDTAAFLALNPPPEQPEPAGRIGLAPEMARDAEGRRKLGPQEKRDQAARDEAARQSWRDTMDSMIAKTG